MVVTNIHPRNRSSKDESNEATTYQTDRDRVVLLEFKQLVAIALTVINTVAKLSPKS